MTFFKTRARRKHAKELLHHCHALRHMRRDILPADVLARLSAAIDGLAATWQGPDAAALAAAVKEAEGVAMAANRPRALPQFRELAETLFVAFGVAMAFRAYFFQPFKIPTGSMQPTLFGHHSVGRHADGSAIEPSFLDRLPFKPLKWIVTGEWFHDIVATEAGTVHVYTDRAKAPGYVFVNVRGKKHRVPQDAFDRGEINVPDRQAAGMADSGDTAIRTIARGYAKAGDRLWSGYVTAGDHVFVNRMKWNFFPPRRGQIVVFGTDGIENLSPGEHYIKRLTGLPGETIGIAPPYLTVDGAKVEEPETILRVAEKREAWPNGPHYLGYAYTGYAVIPPQRPGGQPVRCTLGVEGDTLPLDDNQFLAMGDNTGNSYDGRYWGPVPRRRLVGPASCVYWPWSPRWGRVD
jgi:signal peptidase I